MLVRGRIADKIFFRKLKTGLHLFSRFEQSCLVIGAACLPEDEFINWLKAVKPAFNHPLGQIFLKWVATQREAINEKLSADWDQMDVTG